MQPEIMESPEEIVTTWTSLIRHLKMEETFTHKAMIVQPQKESIQEFLNNEYCPYILSKQQSWRVTTSAYSLQPHIIKSEQ